MFERNIKKQVQILQQLIFSRWKHATHHARTLQHQFTALKEFRQQLQLTSCLQLYVSLALCLAASLTMHIDNNCVMASNNSTTLSFI